MLFRSARVVRVGLPVVDAAREVDPVRAEPLECELEDEDFGEPSYGVAGSTKEAFASSGVPPRFAEMLGVMCVCAGMCECMLAMHNAHKYLTTGLGGSPVIIITGLPPDYPQQQQQQRHNSNNNSATTATTAPQQQQQAI